MVADTRTLLFMREFLNRHFLQLGNGNPLSVNVPKNPESSCLTTINDANPLFMEIGLSGLFQRLDVLGFKITLKTS